MNIPLNQNQRNYGIDFLRIVAAFYVIILHTLNQGGVYEATIPGSYQELLCRMLLIVSYCAVNIFGIISGYVGYRESSKKSTLASYLPLWLTVVFYCVLFAGIYSVVSPGTVTSKDWIKSFFPVTANLFWYFSAYTFVCFLSPFLNKILQHSSEKELRELFLLICGVLVMIDYIGQSFSMEEGYSPLWLLLLYLIGGIMKKLKIGSNIPAYAAFFAIFLIDIGFFYLGLEKTLLRISIFKISFYIHHSYVTPFYLASAVFHVILFSKFKFGKFLQKLIAFTAPAAFSVYIANTNPLFWKFFMRNRFVHWTSSSPVGILARTMIFSFLFVWIVILVDFFRRKLFQLFHVQNWAQNITARLRRKSSII